MRTDLTAGDEAWSSTEDEPARRSPFAGEDWSLRAWLRLLLDLYGTFDRRTLALSRIVLGFLLLMDLIHRGAVFHDLFSDEGVLPVWFSLERRVARGVFSIFNAFSTTGELRVLWALMAAVAVCLMVGYRTKVAQVLALVLFGSMNTRVVFVENGGFGIENLLLLYTVFLPMGDRFSVDALLASLKRRREVTVGGARRSPESSSARPSRRPTRARWASSSSSRSRSSTTSTSSTRTGRAGGTGRRCTTCST